MDQYISTCNKKRGNSVSLCYLWFLSGPLANPNYEHTPATRIKQHCVKGFVHRNIIYAYCFHNYIPGNVYQVEPIFILATNCVLRNGC